MEVALLIVAQLVIPDTTGRGYTLEHLGKGSVSLQLTALALNTF